MDQWNRIENPEVNPHFHGQLIFDQGGKKYNGVKIVYSINSVGNWTDTEKKKKESRPPSYTWNKTPGRKQ